MAQQQRSEETLSKILASAAACFARSGYEATSVAEICAAAGISKGAFYHHFPSKQALFVALLNTWLAGLDERFSAVRLEADSVPSALRAMARAAHSIFSDARGQLPMFLEFWTQAARDPLIWEKTIDPYRRYQGYFADLIRAGIAEGSLRPVDPEAAAKTLIGLAVGMLAQGLVIPAEADWGAMTEQGVEMLLAGLATGSKEQGQ